MARKFVLAAFATYVYAESTLLSFGIGCGYNNSYPTPLLTNIVVESQTISDPSAKFIMLHFSSFNLPPEDYIILKSLTSNDKEVILRGNETHGSFDAPPIVTTKLSIELVVSSHPGNRQECIGFGLSGYESSLFQSSTNEVLCGKDLTQEAVCYNSSILMFSRSKAVARLIVSRDGSLFGCTGWLLGSEGHFITNNHCIMTNNEAKGARYEFNAQATECPKDEYSPNCAKQLACPGKLWTGVARMLYTSKDLDYTLVMLDKSAPNSYGFLRLREASSEVGEPIYVVQHPLARGKRISDKTIAGRATIEIITRTHLGYRLDTQSMSSGSPILSAVSHDVVALHNSASEGCPNWGIRSNLIVEDLRRVGLLPISAV